jgi:pheromone shutdown protein TraB
MRTTVTLDDDIAELLRKRARERDVPFKRVLNEAIRAGLTGGAATAKRYRMKPRKLGVRPGVDLTKALRLAGELEDVEIINELEQGR